MKQIHEKESEPILNQCLTTQVIFCLSVDWIRSLPFEIET